MDYISNRLSNGLRIVHIPTDSPVAYCGFAVNVGTRDEREDEHGMAHFVEHMLFKGTSKRRAWHILNRMENVGGELNAYTTKEETYVYSIFMEKDFNRAMELQADLVFNSQFPEQEIEKEVDVIIDEINSYKDNPSELIFDDFENMVFGSHPLGHNILGDEQTLLTFDTEKGKSFLRRFYTPDNIIFFSMGNRDFKKIISAAESLMGDITTTSDRPNRVAPERLVPYESTVDKETYQAHAMIGGISCSMGDRKRIPLLILNNILGGPGMNSRLNLSLRERHGLVYNVESNLNFYSDTGLASIYFGTDPKNLNKALTLVEKELKKVRNEKLTTSQLSAAIKQLEGQLGVATDNKEGVFLGLGKVMLYFGKYESLSETFAKLEAVTAEDILEVANEVYAPENLFRLIYK